MFKSPRLRSFAQRSLQNVLAAVLLFPAALSAQTIVHVPAEQPTLQQAITAVPNGGIIELAAGTYNAPPGGFIIETSAQVLAKSFTIRAAAGATVILSGEGSHDIVRFANPANDRGRAVTFQGLTFANGVSPTNFLGGAMTVANANAIFVSCIFQNNVANPSITGGGAVWLANATASFQDCVFKNNTSRNNAGALSTYYSRVFIRGCTFVGNRANVPNHFSQASGGAIANSNSEIRIDSSRFEDNHAGYVGGAIFCGAEWKEPLDVPTAQLIVSNSLFVGNSAAPDRSVTSPLPTFAGAVHLEDQTTGRFVNCRFLRNSADQGGAISSYRAISEFEGCVFDGNIATGSIGAAGSGGSIIAISSDVPDSSTNNGTLNRRPIVLTVRDSLFRGAGGGKRDALHGGAIFVMGDNHSAYGLAGVTKNGSEASNRATVDLTRVSFVDLNASGTAGAISAAFVALTMDQSIIENCRSGADGGGLRLINGSTATVTNSTISRCRAGTMAGGVMMFGGTLNIRNCNLVENRLTGPGIGPAMVTGPATTGGGVPGRAADGMIQQCVFSNNGPGAAIYEGDRLDGPFNLIQYSGNDFFSSNGEAALLGDYVAPSTVAELNLLTHVRLDGSVTIKAPSANFAPSSVPIVGALLMIPPVVQQSGAPGEALPIASHLAYTSSGANAVLDGVSQSNQGGTNTTTIDGVHTFGVGPASFSNRPPPSAAVNISTRLPVGTGDNALIGGFIVQGNSPKRVIVRAIGPSLAAFGLTGVLENPTLALHDSTGAVIATNDNWQSSQTGGAVAFDQNIDIHGSGVAPASDLEPAIVATLDPNLPYTAVVRGINNSSGIAVVEVYDLDATRSSTLANISTRGFIQGGDNVMIAGLIVQGGTGPTNIVIRGIGPSTGVAGALADPVLALHDSNGTLVANNDNWGSSAQAALAQAAGLAPVNSAESVLFETNLARGAYTAILRGANNSAGIGLVEAYIFPVR